ncbi:major histocompatibility complex class I-related gene protein-like [Hemicordylus capensis]|uniref:major histocompatibility complex class I-related gene protein-like n=1 Tax=Hemicordylus capensis TaxID=884348 RepID=UPI002302F04A|nr:major histocompatibility complex class I-related gene protein-like [Hemicordylus capensis]
MELLQNHNRGSSVGMCTKKEESDLLNVLPSQQRRRWTGRHDKATHLSAELMIPTRSGQSQPGGASCSPLSVLRPARQQLEDRAPETTDSSQMPLRDAHRLLLGAAALFLLLGGCSGSSSHSVRFPSAVWDSAEGLPQFMSLGYLDDQIFMHHDKKIRQPEPVVPWMKKLVEDDPESWNLLTQLSSDLEEILRQEAAIVQKYGNQSESFVTWQGISFCELREDGQKVGNIRFGYNGRDFLSFDKDTLSWIVVANVTAPQFKKKWDTFSGSPQYWKEFLEGQLIEWLKKYIKYAKESLQRREPPVVKVLRKMDSNGLETLICRAYGFYPKEIHPTWKRDGEFLEQQPLRGDVVPNSDGTYHTWTSINIDPKDRVHYQCQVEHVGFPEPQLFAWKEPAPVGPIVGGILGAVAAVVLLVAGIIFYMKKQQGGYKATSTE